MMEERDTPEFYGGQDRSDLTEQPGPWKEQIQWAKQNNSLEM